MRWTGPIIALYLLYHLADLTWGTLRPPPTTGSAVTRTTTWSSASATRSSPSFYAAATIALVIHLYHGVFSMFQSLGVNNPKINRWKRSISVGVAGILLVGNLSFPIMVQAGLINEDNRTTPIPPEETEQVEEASE